MILRTSLLALCAPIFVSCSTAYEWQEVQTGPASRAEVFDAVAYLAQTDGFLPGANCDRGLGTWESRWRYRHLGMGRPGRFKLLTEMLLDEGSNETGWVVRYRIDQQMVDDLRRALDPTEDDWEDAGQDSEREDQFGQRLRMKLAPESLPGLQIDAGGR